MAHYWFKFEWEVWMNDPQLRRCSKETRGFWIDCLAVMADRQTFFLEGTPAEICRDVVADREEFDRSIAELSRTGAASVEKCQGVVKIVSRRILKQVNLREYNRLKQQESRDRRLVNSDSNAPSKDIEIKSLRTLDSSPNGEEISEAQTEPATGKKVKLPILFQPTSEMIEWAAAEFPGLNLESETEEFVTFWCDIATKNNKRTLRGWNATWKNRMKDRAEKLGIKNNGKTRNYREERNQEAINERNFWNGLRAEVNGSGSSSAKLLESGGADS